MLEHIPKHASLILSKVLGIPLEDHRQRNGLYEGRASERERQIMDDTFFFTSMRTFALSLQNDLAAMSRAVSRFAEVKMRMGGHD